MSSSYTLDFTQYSITDGGNETTYNQHDLNTIFYGDWKFEDISTIDTGGLTAWGKQIEVISESNSNWTIVILTNKDGSNFSLSDITGGRPEGAGIYKLVNPSGFEYEVYNQSDRYGSIEYDQDTLNSNFSNVAYIDFHAKAITDSSIYGRTQTKWHLDDINLSIVVPDNTSPSITGLSGSAGASVSSATISENGTAIGTFNADENVTWSLTSSSTDHIYSGLSYDSETGDFTLNIKSQSDSSVLDVGGNDDTQNVKGLNVQKTLAYTNGSYEQIDIVNYQNGADYRGQTTVIRSNWITEWNGQDPIVVEQTYIDSEGNTYTDNYYYIDGTATNLPSNESYIYGIDINDKDKFSINSLGALSFSSAPDYESPSDSDSSNNYVVVVKATDSSGNSSQQTATISIANVNEFEIAPALTESSTTSLLLKHPSTSNSTDDLKIKIKSSQQADTVNQIGYLILDSGASDTITYDLLNNSSKVLFSSIENKDTPDLSAMILEDSITISNNKKIIFFETIDTTLEQLLSTTNTVEEMGSSIKTLNLSDISTSSAKASNGDNIITITSITGSNSFNDEIFGDMNSTPFLDFSGQSGITFEGTINIAREANYDSKIGFYKIQNSNGAVTDPTTGDLINPGSIGYKEAALHSINEFNSFGVLNAEDNSAAQKTLTSFTSTNLIALYGEVSDTNQTFFAFSDANSDGLSHFREFGNGVFGFEDLYGGGDNDFDDLIFSFEFTESISR